MDRHQWFDQPAHYGHHDGQGRAGVLFAAPEVRIGVIAWCSKSLCTATAGAYPPVELGIGQLSATVLCDELAANAGLPRTVAEKRRTLGLRRLRAVTCRALGVPFRREHCHVSTAA